MSDRGSMCCYYKVDREFELDEVIPIGQPFKNTEILLIDDNNKPNDGYNGTTVYTPKEEEEEETTKENYELNDIIEEYKD